MHRAYSVKYLELSCFYLQIYACFNQNKNVVILSFKCHRIHSFRIFFFFNPILQKVLNNTPITPEKPKYEVEKVGGKCMVLLKANQYLEMPTSLDVLDEKAK